MRFPCDCPPHDRCLLSSVRLSGVHLPAAVFEDRRRCCARGEALLRHEIEPSYVHVDLVRWEAETGGQAVLEAEGIIA